MSNEVIKCGICNHEFHGYDPFYMVDFGFYFKKPETDNNFFRIRYLCTKCLPRVGNTLMKLKQEILNEDKKIAHKTSKGEG